MSEIFYISPETIDYLDMWSILEEISKDLGSEISFFGGYCNTQEIEKELGISSSQIISSNLHESINKFDLIICDISEYNGHVLYGLGCAHALHKPVIQICRNDTNIPFDIASFRTIIYDRNKLYGNFKSKIGHAMQSALHEPNLWIYSSDEKKDSGNRNLFISYSHKDKDWLDRLLVHLKPLEKENIIDLWVDTKLTAGERWKNKIEDSLQKARVAVLLISADFLASDFIIENELPTLLCAAEEEGTRIIPIIIKPCRFARDKILSSFHALNDPNNPIAKMGIVDQEELYDKVSEIIENYMRG